MPWKSARRVGLYALLFAVYLVSTIPVGLVMYSMKNFVGFDLFKRGGFHAYTQCLRQSFPLDRSDGPLRLIQHNGATKSQAPPAKL